MQFEALKSGFQKESTCVKSELSKPDAKLYVKQPSLASPDFSQLGLEQRPETGCNLAVLNPHFEHPLYFNLFFSSGPRHRHHQPSRHEERAVPVSHQTRRHPTESRAEAFQGHQHLNACSFIRAKTKKQFSSFTLF